MIYREMAMISSGVGRCEKKQSIGEHLLLVYCTVCCASASNSGLVIHSNKIILQLGLHLKSVFLKSVLFESVFLTNGEIQGGDMLGRVALMG